MVSGLTIQSKVILKMKNKYSKRSGTRRIPNFLVKREVWVTKATADGLDRYAKTGDISSQVNDSILLFNIVNNRNDLPKFRRDITEGYGVAEDLVGKLVLATLKRGLLWYDLVMIGIDYGLTQYEINSAINGLMSKGMVKLETTNDGPLFKFIKFGNVKTTQRVTSHRGEIVKDERKNKKVVIQKMIPKTVR